MGLKSLRDMGLNLNSGAHKLTMCHKIGNNLSVIQLTYGLELMNTYLEGSEIDLRRRRSLLRKTVALL